MTDNLKRLLLVIYRWIGSFFGPGPDAVAPTPFETPNCIKCGQLTMHMGNVCYKCGHEAELDTLPPPIDFPTVRVECAIAQDADGFLVIHGEENLNGQEVYEHICEDFPGAKLVGTRDIYSKRAFPKPLPPRVSNTAPYLPPITTTGPEPTRLPDEGQAQLDAVMRWNHDRIVHQLTGEKPTRLPLILLALLVPSIAVAAEDGPSFRVSHLRHVAVNQKISIEVELEDPKEDVVVRYRVMAAAPQDAHIELDESPCGLKCSIWCDPGAFEIEVEAVKVANARARTVKTIRFDAHPSDDRKPLPRPQPIPPTPPPIPPVPVPTPTPNPPVPTPPGPVPNPTPVIPDGEFKVSAKVATLIGKINSPNRAAEAKQLADAADSLAAEVAAGTVTNATVVLTRIGAGIKDIKSPQWVAAATEFAALMQATWQEHSKGRLKLTSLGGIVDASGWSTLLRELAVGARAVK